MHQRLMFGMLVYAGVVAIIVLRILYLAAFGDHAGRKEELTAYVPERGDIVDRDGEPLARTIDAWTIAVHPNKLIGDRLTLARQLAKLMPEHSEEQYFALLKSGKPFVYLRRRASPALVEAVNALGEPGLAIEREPDRLYPQTSLAAHVLGFTDIDGHGARELSARLIRSWPIRRRAASLSCSRFRAECSKRLSMSSAMRCSTSPPSGQQAS
jgi:Cell division protein FtsI/penicillin-binding protein 2